MPYTIPPRREEYPREKPLTEQAVPAVPAGGARLVLGLVSLLPAGLITLAIFFRLIDPSRGATLPSSLPLMGIYGLIGSNLAVIYFAVQALKHPYLDPLQRLGWTVVIVMLAPVALPVFWYRHVLHPLRYANEEALARVEGRRIPHRPSRA